MDSGRKGIQGWCFTKNKAAYLVETRRGHVYLDHVYLRTSFGSGGLRKGCLCRKGCFCRSIVLGTVWLLQKYKFYIKNRAQNRVGL